MKRKTAIFVIAWLSSIILTGVFVYAATPTTTFSIYGGNYPGAPNYTIFTDGTNYFAKDARGVIVYSGTTANTVIQNALDNGNSVFVTEGTYPITGLEISNNYVDFYGSGYNTQLYLSNSSDKNMLNVTSDYVSIHDLWFQGNQEGQTSGNGIFLTGSVSSAIYNCYINGTEGHGVYVYYGGANRIYENRITVSAQHCILISTSADNFIQNNDVGNPVGSDYSCIVISGSPMNHIEGNNIYLGKTYNVYIGDYSRRNVISNNIMQASTQENLAIHSGAYSNIIDGNIMIDASYVTTNTYSAVKLDGFNNTITNNVINVAGNPATNGQKYAFTSATGLEDYNIITGNILFAYTDIYHNINATGHDIIANNQELT